MLSIVLVVVLSLTAVHGDSDHHHHLTFADFMKHVQVNYDLTDPNLLLLGELVMAVDDHTLKAQIDRLGFKNVIKLLQRNVSAANSVICVGLVFTSCGVINSLIVYSLSLPLSLSHTHTHTHTR